MLQHVVWSHVDCMSTDRFTCLLMGKLHRVQQGSAMSFPSVSTTHLKDFMTTDVKGNRSAVIDCRRKTGFLYSMLVTGQPDVITTHYHKPEVGYTVNAKQNKRKMPLKNKKSYNT